MPVFDEEDKSLDNAAKYPLYSPKKEKAEKPKKTFGGVSALKKIPVLKIGIIALVLFVVVVLFSLAAKMTAMSEELKQMQTQLAAIQGSVGTKIETTSKERDKLKQEIADLREELDGVKAQQRHLSEEAANQRKAAAEARKVAEAKKAAEPKKKITVVDATKKTGPKEKRPAGEARSSLSY